MTNARSNWHSSSRRKKFYGQPNLSTADALNAVRNYLDPGESAVGTAVNIRHLAATPVGHRVTAEAVVTKVDGRRIEFDVTARDEIEEIGNGTGLRQRSGPSFT